MTTQLVTPNPFIPAEEGMCLQYVRQAFGLPLRYGSATEAWNNSPSQHRDRSYPQGVWFPVWWGLDKNVNGHVALVAPDGSVYSTSNLNPNPVKHHPSIADVESYYAYYGMTLTYRGWTEDVAGFPVISLDGGSINFDSTTPQEDDMALTQDDANLFAQTLLGAKWNLVPNATLGELLNEYRDHHTQLMNAVNDRASAVVNAIFNTPVPNATGGNTTLGALIGWNDSHVNSIIEAAKSGNAPFDPAAVQQAVSAALVQGVHVNITTN